MNEETPWRRLWDSIERAKEELWAAEAQAYQAFLIALRRALEAYAREVDPDSFDEYGQPR